MGITANTIMGVRVGFEIVTSADMVELGVDEEVFKWALILDLAIFRVVLFMQ